MTEPTEADQKKVSRGERRWEKKARRDAKVFFFMTIARSSAHLFTSCVVLMIYIIHHFVLICIDFLFSNATDIAPVVATVVVGIQTTTAIIQIVTIVGIENDRSPPVAVAGTAKGATVIAPASNWLEGSATFGS